MICKTETTAAFLCAMALSVFVLPVSSWAQGSCKGDAALDIHMENIETTRKQAEEYKPKLRDYYVQDFNDNENLYLKAALSPSERKEWLGRWPAEMVRCLTPALDALAAAAKKTLPTYTPAGYIVHNPAEEKLLRDAVDDLGKAKVFATGLLSANWKIDKNDYGLPTSRFKYGMIWAKYPNDDDGFCRIIYVNIVQDYSGGGTYAASEGNFIKSEYAGCPAGK